MRSGRSGRKAHRDEAIALLDLFGLAVHAEKIAATLPEGLRKLADIAIAMALQPRLLLLDEPTSGVSAIERFSLMETLMDVLRRRKITALFVEHDMEVVGRYADRVVVWDAGHVMMEGKPDVVLRRSRASPKCRRGWHDVASRRCAGRHRWRAGSARCPVSRSAWARRRCLWAATVPERRRPCAPSWGFCPLIGGRIRLDAIDLVAAPSHHRARLGIGYAPEDRRLIGAFSVEDNILLPVWRSNSTRARKRRDWPRSIVCCRN